MPKRDLRSFEQLLAELDSPDHMVRIRAVGCLDESRDPRARPAFFAASRDPASGVRLGAAFALGRVRTREARARLLEMLAGDESYVVRSAAAWSLSTVRGKEVGEPLLQALREPDWHVRVAVCAALGRRRGDEVVPALREALHDEEDSVRFRAASSLAKHGDAAGAEVLRANLDHEYDFRQVSAAVALTQLGDEGGPRHLQRLAESPQLKGVFRRTAKKALREWDRRQGSSASGQPPSAAP